MYENDASKKNFLISFFRNECYCDNKFGRYKKLDDDSNCNVPCPKSPNDFCGGSKANSIYLVN